MLGIFSRVNHPEGWGQVTGVQNQARAHGFVTIAVRCHSMKQLAKVTMRLNQTYHKPFLGIPGQYYEDGNLRDWYGGGPFALVFIIPGNKIDIFGSFTKRFRSFGDNQFAGIFKAKEVLAN